MLGTSNLAVLSISNSIKNQGGFVNAYRAILIPDRHYNPNIGIYYA